MFFDRYLTMIDHIFLDITTTLECHCEYVIFAWIHIDWHRPLFYVDCSSNDRDFNQKTDIFHIIPPSYAIDIEILILKKKQRFVQTFHRYSPWALS